MIVVFEFVLFWKLPLFFCESAGIRGNRRGGGRLEWVEDACTSPRVRCVLRFSPKRQRIPRTSFFVTTTDKHTILSVVLCENLA